MAAPSPLAEASSDSSSSHDENWTFDQDLAIDLQLKCIIGANLPFDAVQSHFSEFIQEGLQPKYKWVSSTTLKTHAFDRYMQAKKDLIKHFENLQSKVSLTIHAWKTSGENFSPYICITCHWFDPETWKVSKRIISLQQTGYPYKPKKLYDFIMRSISEFGVKDKIASITYDSPAINMMKTEVNVNPRFNGVFFHTKCVWHILNSMVQSSLDYVAPVVTKFQNFVYIFRSHKDDFKHFVRSQGDIYIGIGTNIPNEWNTTYTTLKRMVKQKELIVEFYASFGETDIDNNDWKIIESLLGILREFHSSVERLSFNAYRPTAHLGLGEIWSIAYMFKEYKQNPFWEPVILEMQLKFLKYYKTIPPVFTCAAALDPNIGIAGVEKMIEDIGGYLDMNDNINDIDYADYADFASVSKTKCSTALNQLFGYYEKMYRLRARETWNELELYKKMDFSKVMCGDMVQWWKEKGVHQYPILGEMVGDLLTVQASTMALEYAFCLNGRVLDEMMTYKLSSQSLQMRSFLQDHFEEGGLNVNSGEDGSDESEEDDVSYSDSSDRSDR